MLLFLRAVSTLTVSRFYRCVRSSFFRLPNQFPQGCIRRVLRSAVVARSPVEDGWCAREDGCGGHSRDT